MQLSECGARLISQFEGYSSTAYWDSYGAVWTIGYGTTGPHAYPGATCTREQALQWLREEADGKDSPGINALGLRLSQQRHDALVSFSYNLGPGIITDPSTAIGSALRTGGDVPSALMQYTHAGGKELPGLVARRHTEGVLWLTGDYGFPCSAVRARKEDDMPQVDVPPGECRPLQYDGSPGVIQLWSDDANVKNGEYVFHEGSHVRISFGNKGDWHIEELIVLPKQEDQRWPLPTTPGGVNVCNKGPNPVSLFVKYDP